jgi:4-hydroxy-tetrahydrodipicolinate reductase
MIRIVLVGAAGRMGRAVEAAAAGAADLAISARVDLSANFPADAGVWSESVASVLGRGDVVVDFSSPRGAREAAAACVEKGAALVSGSTGLTGEDAAALQAAALRVAVLRASNFSLGVAALRVALRSALAAVPSDWDVEIVERHHRMKKDSPSGTALALAADVRLARSLPESALRHGRQGAVGQRPAGEVGVHAVRGGTWVGDHQVLLAGDGEWLELRHVAQDRAAFANGALAAARFVATAGPGAYTLEDVLRAPAAARSARNPAR